ETGVRHLLSDKFTIGGQGAAVAGPVGRTAQAATDLQLHAQILSWSRSRGLFLGVSLDGVVIKPNKDANELFYGQPLTARRILVWRLARLHWLGLRRSAGGHLAGTAGEIPLRVRGRHRRAALPRGLVDSGVGLVRRGPWMAVGPGSAPGVRRLSGCSAIPW